MIKFVKNSVTVIPSCSALLFSRWYNGAVMKIDKFLLSLARDLGIVCVCVVGVLTLFVKLFFDFSLFVGGDYTPPKMLMPSESLSSRQNAVGRYCTATPSSARILRIAGRALSNARS